MIKILDKVEGGRYGIGDWCTHIPLLLTVLVRVKPLRVLELGAGDYSTGMLNAYALTDPNVEITSLENDGTWCAGLQWMTLPNHQILKISEWDYTQYPGPWDFVFIDQAPEPERIPALRYFRDQGTGIVLIHDCNYPERYAELLSGFTHQVHDRRNRFHTTIASSVYDIGSWFP